MLTDKALKALKPRERPYKRADEKGLLVIVRPDGAVWWRLKYRYGNKEKSLSLGTYPDVSLKRAREKRDEARQLLDRGVDPSVERRAAKSAHVDSFEILAREWLALQRRKLAATTHEKATWMLETFVFPSIGSRPIGEIEPPDLLRLLRRIEARGRRETAHRTRQRVSQVFRFAVASGRCDRDPATDLKGALEPITRNSFAAITDPMKVGELLRAIDGYQGQPAVIAALKLAPLVFVRPGELRAAEWSEININTAEWRVPAERTKMRKEHTVPLATQSVALLEELKPVTGGGRLVFPSLRSKDRPLSENTLNAALRNLGYDGSTHVAHGFRVTASTLLHELGYAPEVIETQLAHVRPGVAGVYNRSHLLPQRRKMMQAWADHLDMLHAGAKVTAIRA